MAASSHYRENSLTIETPAPQRKRLLTAAGLAAFMATMDTSLVSVGLPQLAAVFETSLATISWVMVVYLLANASLQIVVGRLADLTAPGRLFVTGVALFASASGLGGVSPNLPVLLACRLVQGVGAALMLGVAPKLIASGFPEEQRGFALGLFSAGFGSGVTLGAPLGGLLLTFGTWRALFFVNLLLGGLVLAVGLPVTARLRPSPKWDWRTVDAGGGVILTLTLALFILTLTSLRDQGWGEVRNLVGLALVTGGLGLLILTERRQPHPLLHRELWHSRGFLLGSFGVLAAFATVMGTFFLLPFFLVQVFGYSPAKVGLTLAVLSLSNAMMSFLGGYLADRLGNVIILRIGLGFIGVGLLSLGLVSPQTSPLSLALRLAVTGMGLGLFSAPNLNEILRGVRASLVGLAASTNAVLKNLGSLLGVVLLVGALGMGQSGELTLKAGACLAPECYQQAFRLAAALAGVNFLINLLPRTLIFWETKTGAG